MLLLLIVIAVVSLWAFRSRPAPPMSSEELTQMRQFELATDSINLKPTNKSSKQDNKQKDGNTKRSDKDRQKSSQAKEHAKTPAKKTTPKGPPPEVDRF